MDARTKAQLMAKLEELAHNPEQMPGVKPMHGEWAGHHRLRHGDLRVIFVHDALRTRSSSGTSVRAATFTSKKLRCGDSSFFSPPAKPFDPTKPANDAPLNAGEMRTQLTALNDDLQQRATQAELAAALGSTSANSYAVGTLGMAVSDPPTQGEVQAIADKLDELINTLRR